MQASGTFISKICLKNLATAIELKTKLKHILGAILE